MSANSDFKRHNTQDANIKTHLETREDQGPTITHWNTVRVASQKLLEPLSVTKIVVTTKVRGLLHFFADPNFVTQGGLPVKDLVEALANPPIR